MPILLPLYIYPWPGVWDPLYTADHRTPYRQLHRDHQPLFRPLPQRCPRSALPRRDPQAKSPWQHSHAWLRGDQLHQKPIDQVIQEIQTYATWSQILDDPWMAVEGIFFDEVSGAYDWRNYSYYETAQSEVKSWEGLGEQVIVHNPGTVPDPVWNYLNLSDITVIFEDAFMNYIDRTSGDKLTAFQTLSGHPKSALAIMLHSMPDVTDSFLSCVVKQMEGMVDWLFATSVSIPGAFWHQFSPLFDGLIAAIDSSEG